jgi:hypothetical protein
MRRSLSFSIIVGSPARNTLTAFVARVVARPSAATIATSQGHGRDHFSPAASPVCSERLPGFPAGGSGQALLERCRFV